MKRIKLGILSLSVLVLLAMIANDVLFVKKQYQMVDVDVLGNVLLSDGQSLDKYNSKGNLIYHYSHVSEGTISDIDADDAMNLWVYYKDFQKIHLLDSDLSPKTKAIDLSDMGYQDVLLICSSFNNGVWLWEDQSAQLIRIDNRLKEDQKTGNVHALVGKQISPVKMREGNQYLVLMDTTSGFYFFDRFGVYLKNLPYKSVKDFEFVDQNLVFIQNDTLHTLNTRSNKVSKKALSVSDVKDFGMAKDQLILIDEANHVYARKIK